MKTILRILLSVLFVFSFSDFSSASLNMENDSSAAAANQESELYCGLALPVEGEPEGKGGETDNTQEEPQDGSESKPDSESPSNDQPGK